MSRKLFIARSGHDIGNSYLFAYSQAIIDEAERRNWRVEKADGGDDCRNNVTARLSNGPQLAVFNGHGSEDEVCGHKDEVVIDSSNAGLLQGTVSFIRACGCLNGIGRSAVKKGAKAVVGYRGDFWIPRVNEFAATPLRDPSAKPVLEASNAVAYRLLKGARVKDAVEASKARANNAIRQMLTRVEPYDSPALRALVNNNLLIDFEGDQNAVASIG